jgi:hypothetical protein
MSLLNNYPEVHEKIKGVIIGDIAPVNYHNKENSKWLEMQFMLDNLCTIKIQEKSFAKIRTEIENIC